MTKKEFKYCKAQKLDDIGYIYVWKSCKDLLKHGSIVIFSTETVYNYKFIIIDRNKYFDIVGDYIHFYNRESRFVKSYKFQIHRKYIKKLC